MRTTFRLQRACAVALALAFAFAATHLPLRAQSPRERTMYVSAVDEKGEPVDAALGPADFVIREDGAAREVLRVSRAMDSMDIAVLVDTGAASEGALPRIREGLTSFIAKMTMGNQIAIVGLADRPTILVDYTSNTKRLQDGIGLLWPRSQSGTTLLDAIYEVSRGLEKRETTRAVILPVITDGGDYANRQYKQVADEVKQAGASIHAITIGVFAPTDDDDLRNRARVLSETTRVSGGQRVTLLVASAVQQALERLGRELSSQYKVVYGRPDSLIPPEKIEVSARRPGVTMRGTLERGMRNAK
jgi:Mg-chelatase subunit ChlD